LAWAALCGCQENRPEAHSGSQLDTELVKTLNHIEVENAIIAQHTLYPYHFVTGSEQLNNLGRRDFDVLARHFAEHPGTLNLRRGDTGPELYKMRLGHVLSQLKEAGVDMGRLQISDGLAGGSGMSSAQVVLVLEQAAEGPTASGLPRSGRITER